MRDVSDHIQVDNIAKNGKRVEICGRDVLGKMDGQSPCVAGRRVRGVWKGLPPLTDGTTKSVEFYMDKKVFSGTLDPDTRDEAACFECGGFVA